MESNFEQTYWPIFIIIIFIFVISLTEKSSISDYYRTCNFPNVEKEKCTSWNVSKEIYFVNKYTQQVMFMGDYGPVSFEKCVVVNYENWTCNDGVLNVKDGTITSNYNMFSSEHFGWFKYWFYKVL